MKVRVDYTVAVVMEIDDKFEVLTVEEDDILMNELEDIVVKNSPFEKVKVVEGYATPEEGEYILAGVYTADEDLAMLEY